MSGLSENPLGYLGRPASKVAEVIREERNPAASDDNFNTGDIWINTASNTSFLLVSNVAGAAIWNPTGTPGGAVNTLGGGAGTAIPVGNNIDVVGTPAQGITSSAAGDTVTFTVQDATTVAKGVSSFDGTDFSVVAGVVSLLGTGAMETLTGDSGGALSPTAGNINIVSTATNGIGVAGAGSTLTVGMSSPYGDGSFSFLRSAVGSTNQVVIENNDNTNALSSAALVLNNGGASGGDVYVQYNLTTEAQYSSGADNTDNKYKITDGLGVSVGNTLLAATSALVELPVNIVDQSSANVGGEVVLKASNTDNTNAGSDVGIQSIAGGASGGDPYLRADIAGVVATSFGIDNSDGDKFKLTYGAGATPSTGTAFYNYDPAASGVITEEAATLRFVGISGSFAGSAKSEQQAGLQTPNATPAVLDSVTLADPNTVTVVWQLSVANAGSTEAGGGTVTATARRGGGRAVLVGTPNVIFNEDITGSPSVTAVVSGNDLQLQVTGIAGVLNWICTGTVQPLITNA